MRRLSSLAVATLLIVTLAGAGIAGEIVEFGRAGGGPAPESGVDWGALFDDLGHLRQPSFPHTGWRDALFVEDRISRGERTDISVLQRAADPADWAVYNGHVAAPHDLGNTYVLTRVEGIDVKLDLRVERLAGDAGEASEIEIELNHDIVALSSGHRVPTGELQSDYELRWPFRGERRDDDLRIRIGLDGAQVGSIELERWSEVEGVSGFHTFETDENLAGERCFGIPSFYRACGAALVPDSRGRRFIANGEPETAYDPDSYVELSLNLGYLLELDPGFTTVTVRTPADIAFGSFRAFGRFAGHQPAGVAATDGGDR